MSRIFNRFAVTGELVEVDTLRYTPAGIACIELTIRHASTQQEAGMARQVRCDIPAVAYGPVAQLSSGLRPGQQVSAEGFIAQRSLRSTQLVMHVDNITLEQEV